MTSELMRAQAFLGYGTFNRNHPELRDGEVFIGNTTPPIDPEFYPFETCRLGETCYRIDGSRIDTEPSWRPIFVQLSELEEQAIHEVHRLYGRNGAEDNVEKLMAPFA